MAAALLPDLGPVASQLCKASCQKRYIKLLLVLHCQVKNTHS